MSGEQVRIEQLEAQARRAAAGLVSEASLVLPPDLYPLVVNLVARGWVDGRLSALGLKLGETS